MAFINLRKPPPEAASQAPAASPDNPEFIRRRARQRLMGATVLVLIAVIGLPLLFDSQPRPIPVDIPIDIPDRNKVKPLAAADATVAASAADAKAVPKPAAAPEAKPEPKAEPKAEARAEPAPAAEPKPEVKAEAKPVPKAEPKPTSKDDGQRARALLEGQGGSVEPADSRFVVQVGAYAEADRAREVRLKLERSGLKTYTHVAETKEGKRIRVRLGPFTQRADADRAAGKVKALGLEAAVLSL